MTRFALLLPFAPLLAASALAGGAGRPAGKPQTVQATTTAAQNNQAIGGQKDAHGCLPSTGATWSALKKECVQVFDVADIKMDDPKDSTLAAYVILSADKKQGELFTASLGSTMLKQTNGGYVSANGLIRVLRVGSDWVLKY